MSNTTLFLSHYLFVFFPLLFNLAFNLFFLHKDNSKQFVNKLQLSLYLFYYSQTISITIIDYDRFENKQQIVVGSE